jgi:peroxiredoxin
MDPIAVGLTLAGVVLALGCWLGYWLVLQHGRLLVRLEALERQPEQGSAAGFALPWALPVGSVLRDFDLPTLAGGRMTLSQWRGQRLLLILVDPPSRFSRELLSGLAALPSGPGDGRPVPLVLAIGDADVNRAVFDAHGIGCRVLLHEHGEITSLLWVDAPPMAYPVDEQGRTAGPLAIGAPAVLALARGGRAETNGRAEPPTSDGSGSMRDLATRAPRWYRVTRDGLVGGTPAPSFRLPRLDGGELSLGEYRGRRVLLVFSDPASRPCNELAPELERLHRRVRDLQVLVVSRGAPEANRAQAAEDGLTFPIVLQRHWEVSRDYEMVATPIAYLIDEQGLVATDVAVGADAILRLAAQATGSPKEIIQRGT